jgi:hypothetical protein
MSTTTLSAATILTPSFSTTPAIGSGLQAASGNAAVQAAIALVTGAQSSQINISWAEQISVTSGTPFTLNLISGGDSVYGNTMSMTHLVCLYFINLSTVAGQTFTVGAGTHPAMGSDQGTAFPNNGHFWVCQPGPSYVLGAGANDTITVTVAAGTAVQGILALAGRTGIS